MVKLRKLGACEAFMNVKLESPISLYTFGYRGYRPHPLREVRVNNCELCFVCAVAYHVCSKKWRRGPRKSDDSGEVSEENMCERLGFNEAERRRTAHAL